MRLLPSRSFPPFACVLLAALAQPAAAWTPDQCGDTANATEFRDTTAALVLGRRPDLVAARITTCRTSVPGDEQDAFDACVKRDADYAALLVRPGLGLAVSNDDFHTAHGAGNLAISPLLADETLFTLLQATNLADIASVNATVARIKARYPAAIVLPYVSPTTNGLDAPRDGDNRGRIVVWVNDATNNVSRYVQFSVNASSASVSGTRTGAIQRRQASVVNIKRADPGKGTYIFDWRRSDPTAHSFTYDGAFGNNDHCYACHQSGVLAIHPFESAWATPTGGPNDDVGEAAAKLGPSYATWLDALNKKYKAEALKMNNQINTDWEAEAHQVAGAPSGASMEPPFPQMLLDPGSSTACTTDQRTAVGALRPRGALSKKEWKTDWWNYLTTVNGRVGAYVQARPEVEIYRCTTCHNERGTTIYDPGAYDVLITKFVGAGFMPPNIPKYVYSDTPNVQKNSVPLATRMAGAECFINDMRAKALTWLKGTACP
jgi:hypothetical protein